jgi:hypothetical protein
VRTGLVVLAVVVALVGGVRLWMSAPSDAVHITITHVNQDLSRPLIKTVTADRTIHNSTIAQRLQRDLAALPVLHQPSDPNAVVSCSGGPDDTYTLMWYRAGLPVEEASMNREYCSIWRDDGIVLRWPLGGQVLLDDIDAALHASN